MTQEYTYRTVRFSRADIELFSAASGDRNPLHNSEEYARQTVYGQPVVFGALGAVAALSFIHDDPELRIGNLQAEFLRPMFLGVDYTIRAAGGGFERSAVIYDGTTEILRVAISLQKAVAPNVSREVQRAAKLFGRREAADRAQDEMVPGLKVAGAYSIDPEALDALRDRYGGVNGSMAYAAVCWSSYLIGMELPGKSALFSRLQLSFGGREPGGLPLDYLACLRTVDPRLGQLRLDVSIAAEGEELASGELRTFIRSNAPALDSGPAAQASTEMAGKVALVIGSSRGLGAATKTALEARGAAVYSISRSAGGLNSATGDARDAAVLRQMLDRIVRERGRLDILVCNAFPALVPLRLELNALERMKDYLSASLTLVLAPLCTFLAVLDANHGCVALISSAAVNHPVREWPHYVAAKRAAEAIAEVALLQYPRIGMLIVRPDKMLTAMTNTPMGKRGATPPASVAKLIADQVAKPMEPGKLRFLA